MSTQRNIAHLDRQYHLSKYELQAAIYECHYYEKRCAERYKEFIRASRKRFIGYFKYYCIKALKFITG